MNILLIITLSFIGLIISYYIINFLHLKITLQKRYEILSKSYAVLFALKAKADNSKQKEIDDQLDLIDKELKEIEKQLSTRR